MAYYYYLSFTILCFNIESIVICTSYFSPLVAVLLTLPSCISCSVICIFFHQADLIISQAYSSLSPIVHIVNVQSSGKESHANVNVCSIPKLFNFLLPIKNFYLHTRAEFVKYHWYACNSCLCPSPFLQEIHEGLHFTSDENAYEDFGIFSVKFSKDGKEVVIGNNERSIHVYDLAANKVSVRIRAHIVWNHLSNTILFDLLCCVCFPCMIEKK